ncbi:glutathione S-transferase B-like isoform X2 [Dermacentor andersoni]|uniref:glutathione S-transferase B-like isoform X2 n=1 Tax=Dermacentor andersoni TaxID=34620 RepID=UPI0021551518|nr:glutathione S-transferase B-like isoform X2 [Dermacentor andersoni]
MAPSVLGYWDIRGLGEPIRYLLAHAGVPYEDKRYSDGKGPEPSRDEWLAEMHKLGLDFPDLPYLIDGDVRMTQCQAILRYLGRKLGLVPKEERALQRVEMLEHQASDVMWATIRLCYDPGYTEDKRRQFLVDIAEKLHEFEAYLDKHGPFGAGKNVTYVDFLLYESLQVVKTLGPSTFRKGYPALQEYCQRVAALQGLKEYLVSDRFKPWPIWSPYAKALSAHSKPPADDC